MRISRSQRSHAAFSWLELLVVIVTVMLLFVVFAMIQPVSGSGKVRAKRINCVSNLKQVGLGQRMWSNDHEDHFPWTVSTNKEGTLEYAASAEVFRHFMVLSNELASPKVLVCASDPGRLRARDFSTPLANSNVSYFIGLDANEAKPQTILSGDRNIVGGVTSAAWLVFGPTNNPSWTRDIHLLAGNIGLGDGSVQQVTTQALARQFQAALRSQTNPVMRLAIPRTAQDEAPSLWSSGLLRPLLGALLGGLVVLALWIVVRRGLLAASADAAPPQNTGASSPPRDQA
jgi:hypothetical protein